MGPSWHQYGPALKQHVLKQLSATGPCSIFLGPCLNVLNQSSWFRIILSSEGFGPVHTCEGCKTARAGPIRAHMGTYFRLLVQFRTFRVQSWIFEEISKWFCMVLRRGVQKTMFLSFSMQCHAESFRHFIKDSALDRNVRNWTKSRAIWARMGPARALEEQENFRKNSSFKHILIKNRCFWPPYDDFW